MHEHQGASRCHKERPRTNFDLPPFSPSRFFRPSVARHLRIQRQPNPEMPEMPDAAPDAESSDDVFSRGGEATRARARNAMRRIVARVPHPAFNRRIPLVQTSEITNGRPCERNGMFLMNGNAARTRARTRRVQAFVSSSYPYARNRNARARARKARFCEYIGSDRRLSPETIALLPTLSPPLPR